jgi:hypothetical protein
MITTIFDALGDIVTSVIAWFGDIFNGVAELFYTAGTGGSAGSLTLLGTLSLIGVGVGAFYFVLRWIISLIRVRVKG